MRIMLVCRAFSTHRPGGMLHVVEDRAEALAALGHDVHVVTTGVLGDQRAFDVPRAGYTVHHTDSPPCDYSHEFALESMRLSVTLQPDILHFDSFDRSRPWWVGCNRRMRIACTMHGFGMGAFLTKWNLFREGIEPTAPVFNAAEMDREAAAIRKFDVVIGISKHEHWMLRDCYGVRNAKLVYNPIAPYFFDRPTTIAKASKVFLCAAISGHSIRGFDIARKAAEQIGATVRTVSNVPRCEMPDVYDECQAVVIPTFYSQGFDLTVTEALARRRPVIASSTGSYIREESRLWPYLSTVPLNDVDALAKAMSNIVAPLAESIDTGAHPKNHAVAWLRAILP